MTRADIIGGLLLAAFFGAALWEGWSFQYGTEFAPGPGFAPVWLSAIGLVIASAIAFAGWRSSRRFDRTKEPSAVDSEPLDRPGFLRVIATLLGLAAMLAAVPWIGFVPAILGFLLVLTLAVQRLPWPTGIAASMGTVAFIYMIFVYFLNVPIPPGPLGF